MDPCEQHLILLRDELARRGVRCELDDRGVWPRLRIYCPGETVGAEFDNNVVAAPISGRWRYCWPSAIPIGRVTRLTQAAETIIDELGVASESERMSVASRALRRTLDRQAGASPARSRRQIWLRGTAWHSAARGRRRARRAGRRQTPR